MDQQDFPDLEPVGGKSEAPKSRAEGAMMFGGGSTAKGPRDAAPEQTKAAPKKPVFQGRAKLDTGAATVEEVSNSRMNYDFSKMKLSAATSGAKRVEGEERT